MRIDDAIDKLNRAYKRLEEPQGRLARKNARNAFLYALQCLRKGLDDEYPLERKPVARRRKPDPQRATRGKALISPATHRKLLAAGISPGAFTVRGATPGPRGGEAIFAPEWMKRARSAGIDVKLIKEAVRSMPKRRRIQAMLRLGKATVSRED